MSTRNERVERIYFEEVSTGPVEVGEAVYKDGAWVFKDNTGTFDPREGGGGELAVRKLIITSEGGIVYNGDGEFVLKENA
jgi:hypothetical protein